MTSDATQPRGLFALMAQRTKEGRRARWLFSILCLVLLGAECYGSYTVFTSSATTPETLRSASTEEDQQRALSEVPFERAYMEMRMSSLETAQLASASAGNPFRRPAAAIEVPPMVPSIGPDGVPVAPPPEVQPPMVTVRAVMILGSKAAAVADIEGDGQAVILRVGSSFDGGRGKVLNISTSGLRFRWRERVYDAAFQAN
ncbi:hypothetical protein [Thermanaerovibrio acidaminovorans]|uniref:hypothetical protein n=1 Tax=Thermanaerovibrio acidaminovorans TaxID=81462 RepID=UPI002492D30C|nr:hypothetical protein [Thermanaerovibrio acidaminovorans]